MGSATNGAATSSPGPSPDAARLHSWKEIAAYLQRDVRTVQRWEKNEGLPIHRREGNVGGVFAFRGELDAWWTTKQGRGANGIRPSAVRRYALWGVPAIVALVVFAGAMVTNLRSNRPPAPAGEPSLSMRRVWTGTGVVPLVAVSADGRFLTFSNPENGNLALVELTTGRQRDLTSKQSWFDSPAFSRSSRISPDNSHVAFDWLLGDGRHELHVAALSGGEPRVLFRVDGATFILPTAWSADGTRIVVTTGLADGSCSVAIVSSSDGSRQTLKTFHAGCPDVAGFSPDEREVVWSHPPAAGDASHDVFAFAIEEQRERPLIQHAANDRAVGWTSDGAALLFTSDRSGTHDLWQLPLRDGRPVEPVLLRRELGRTFSAGLTRDDAMYYASSVSLDDVYVATLDPQTGRLIQAPSRVGDLAQGANSYPDWSADGESLAYIRRHSINGSGAGRARFSLVIRSVSDGSEREVVPRPPFLQMYRLRWSPDGRAVAVSATDEARRFGVYTIAVADGAVRAVENGDRFAHGDPQPAWSPDGRALLFVAHPAGSSTRVLLARDLQSGHERVISRETGALAFTPDGKGLATGTVDPSRKRSVLTVSLAGGKPRTVLEIDSPGAFGTTLAWTPDGRYIFFTVPAATKEEPAALWRVPAAGGQPEKLALAMPGLREVRVHPDGRRIAFFAQQTMTEVWLMENLLPR